MREGNYGVVLNNRRTLMVKKKDFYIFPGGKIEENENFKKCLEREFSQELSGTQIEVGEFYKDFSGVGPISEQEILCHHYFCRIVGPLKEGSSEISEKKYVNSKNMSELNVSNISKKVLISLINDNLID